MPEQEAGQEFVDNKYVHRLMRARCSCGSLDNYLNIETDHGVLAGEEQQPLMNANDHMAGVNVIHFGNCNSEENPERVFRKKLVGDILGGTFLGGVISDALEDIGIMSFKCTPKTDEVWEQTNDRNILDGAPALLMGSCLTCRYGGTITLVPEDEYPQEDTGEESGGETDNQEETKEDTVRAETDAVLAEAMEKITATGEKGQAAVIEAQEYMALVASTTATEAAHVCNDPKGYFTEKYEPNWIKALVCTPAQRKENYEHNSSIEFEGEYLNSNGMIINQGVMHDFHINNFTVAKTGCGAIAAYNACKILDPENVPTFADVISEMEPYGILNNTYGLMPAGVGDYFVSGGYDVSYEVSDIGESAKEADVCVLYYISLNPDNPYGHFITLEKNSEGTFNVYNLQYGNENDVRTFEEIEEAIYPSAMLGITISKKD